MINLGRLDRDWYEGIVQKLKWNEPLRPGQQSTALQSLDFEPTGWSGEWPGD